VPLANDNTGGATGWCLEVHDLAVSKLVAGQDKDLNFVRVLERPLAAYLLHRDFTANAPNQRWAGDTSESLVGESRSKLLLATIPDLFPRFVVAWAVSAVNDRHPTLTALGMAIKVN
jgi:transposase InsO family protein